MFRRLIICKAQKILIWLCRLVPSSSGQDIRFSFWEQGFDSPWDCQNKKRRLVRRFLFCCMSHGESNTVVGVRPAAKRRAGRHTKFELWTLNFELFIVTFDRGISALRGGVQSMNLVGVYPQIYTARHIRDAPRPSIHAGANFCYAPSGTTGRRNAHLPSQ